VNALPGLFVVGTDTGVGKTHVASSIARSLAREGRRVGVLKPVATGVGQGEGRDVDRGDDARRLIAAAGGSIPIPPERVVPLAFAEPLAPAVASRRLGKPLDPAEVERLVVAALDWWQERADIMVVEGIGGLLTPIAEGTTVADLAIVLDYPLVVVARRGLGTLNHTLLTLEAARRRGLRIAGVVLNGDGPTREGEALAEATNADELARRVVDVAVLAEIPFGDGTGVTDAVLRDCDWSSRALLPRYWPSMTDRIAPPTNAASEEPDQR
jgi:dethiobiotin synthetase